MFAEFWGRNRKWVLMGAGLLVAAIAASVALVASRVDHDAAAPDTGATPVSTVGATVTVSDSVTGELSASSAPTGSSEHPMLYLPGSDPVDSRLVGGQTNHLVFAEKLAAVLFSYDPTTNFAARNADLMQVALPSPLGDAAGLQTDLTRYTPVGAALTEIRKQKTRATFKAQTVSVSIWAAQKLEDIGAQSGIYGIDVVGIQTITEEGAAPVSLSISMGLTVACAPAVTFCGLDRVQAELLGQPSAG